MSINTGCSVVTYSPDMLHTAHCTPWKNPNGPISAVLVKHRAAKIWQMTSTSVMACCKVCVGYATGQTDCTDLVSHEPFAQQNPGCLAKAVC